MRTIKLLTDILILTAAILITHNTLSTISNQETPTPPTIDMTHATLLYHATTNDHPLIQTHHPPAQQPYPVLPLITKTTAYS